MRYEQIYTQRDAEPAIVPACIPFAIIYIGGIKMGAYSEMDLDMQFGSDNPFLSDSEVSAPIQAVSQNQQVSGSVAPTRPKPPQADEAKEKAADEDAAKRKADEDARRRAGAVG